jgi:hypothetical protein
MAEAFGIGASIIGVIGYGSTIQIVQVVAKFKSDWQDAPDNVKSFMAELGTLKTVLSETITNLLLNLDFAEAFRNLPFRKWKARGSSETVDYNNLKSINGLS